MNREYGHPEEYLYSLTRKGDKLGLDKVREFLTQLNDPQDSYETVIIGGTNGKGSVTTLVSNVLTRAGYRTGRYISPHLVFFEERISVDGSLITEEELWSLIHQVKPVLEEIDSRNPEKRPSFFEVLTALAFLHYRDRKADMAVLEVGMGGRLDATNVTEHIVSTVTNVGMDHMEHLGNTKDKIAYEKAGIIRQDNLFVTGEKDPGVADYFRGVCRERKADFRHAFEREHQILESPLRLKLPEYGEFRVPGMARWQGENAMVALGVLEALKGKGYRIRDKHITEGFSKTHLPGKMETISREPWIMIDSAHNVPGMVELARSLKKMKHERLLLVMGVLDDKDHKGMVDTIGPLCHRAFTAEPVSTRTLPSEVLARELEEHCQSEAYNHGIDALRAAEEEWREGDLILVAGSIYLLGDMIKRRNHCEK